MNATARVVLRIQAAALDDDLSVDYGHGTFGISLTDHSDTVRVWLVGTPTELAGFSDRVREIAATLDVEVAS